VKNKKPKATMHEVEVALERIDFALWFQKCNFKDAKLRIEAELNRSVSYPQIKAAMEHKTKWWKKQPRVSPARKTTLLEFEWEQLRAIVIRLKDSITNVPIDSAVAIVSIHFRCNRSLLLGLNSDVRFWQDIDIPLPSFLEKSK
jgi:hypothetical protein